MKRKLALISFAVSTVVGPILPAIGAGPFDGDWYVDAPAAAQYSSSDIPSGCDAVRLPFHVAGNQISGRLMRSPYGTGRVEEGSGSSAPPITGTVQPDGTINAQWLNYHATGKLTGDRAEVRWNGECGPRVATGGRAK